MSKGKIYLIPSLLGENAPMQSLSGLTLSIINSIDHYLAENEKHTRRFLKAAGITKPIAELDIKPLNEHTATSELSLLLEPARNGFDMGIISEAGCPAIADPGADVVRIAQAENIRVIPIPGPSSIFLALMASGFSGQQFSFIGYLPKEQNDRIRKLKEMENQVRKGITQIFMDTPYRNNHVMEDLLKNCDPATKLCVARDITLPEEYIRTKTIATWKKEKPELHKHPCIFILG